MNLRGRPTAFLLVVAAHALIVAGLRQLAPWSDRHAVVETTPLRLRLAQPVEPLRDRPSPALRVVAPSLPMPPWAPVPTLSHVPAQAITVAPALQPAPATAASAATARTLDLKLPPAQMRVPSARQRALDDPRANSKPQTVESRIAEAVSENLPLTMEDLGEGRKRYRRGRACVEVHDARIATIDPFNESFRPSPKQVRACD